MQFLKAVCFAGSILLVASGAGAIEPGQSGLGLLGSANVPVFRFGDWYSISPKVGITYNYMVSSQIMAEVEYHYSNMLGGDLDKREFYWPVDKKNYQSPNASQSMWSHSLSANGVVHLKPLQETGTAPYLMGGVGFYGFSHEVEGLIFPAQTGETLDASIQLEPYKDKWAALNFALGGGLSIVTSDRYLVDIRAVYNIALGELRPLEAWGLEKAFPIQTFDLTIGLKYFW